MRELPIMDLKDLQKRIRVKVEFYDDDEEKKFLEYPNAKRITEIIGNTLEIPTQEFLTYYLFHRKRPGKEGYRNYHEIGQKIGKSINDLEDWIEFNESSISVPGDVERQIKNITEHVGESVGLSVINRIHDLVEADWDYIPEHSGRTGFPTFDYQIASDGTNIVQMESKGSVTANNDTKSSSVSNHKANILNKKAAIGNKARESGYPYKANVHYGTITVLDARKDSIARCWLVDPEPENIDTPPSKLRLINRMRFLRDWVSFISSRSQLAAAIATRLTDIENLSNPFELDGVPLRKGNGDKLVLEAPDRWGYGGSYFYNNRSRVTDGPAGGVVLQISGSALFFLGMRDELPVIAANQEFEKIVSYKSETGRITKTIKCVFSESRFKNMNLPENIFEQAEKVGPYYKFRLSGEMHYSQDGIVYGLLSLD